MKPNRPGQAINQKNQDPQRRQADRIRVSLANALRSKLQTYQNQYKSTGTIHGDLGPAERILADSISTHVKPDVLKLLKSIEVKAELAATIARQFKEAGFLEFSAMLVAEKLFGHDSALIAVLNQSPTDRQQEPPVATSKSQIGIQSSRGSSSGARKPAPSSGRPVEVSDIHRSTVSFTRRVSDMRSPVLNGFDTLAPEHESPWNEVSERTKINMPEYLGFKKDGLMLIHPRTMRGDMFKPEISALYQGFLKPSGTLVLPDTLDAQALHHEIMATEPENRGRHEQLLQERANVIIDFIEGSVTNKSSVQYIRDKAQALRSDLNAISEQVPVIKMNGEDANGIKMSLYDYGRSRIYSVQDQSNNTTSVSVDSDGIIAIHSYRENRRQREDFVMYCREHEHPKAKLGYSLL